MADNETYAMEGRETASSIESRETASSMDSSLKKVVDVLSEISEQNRTLLQGSASGLGRLGGDISAAVGGLSMLGAQMAPTTHTDPAIAMRPHYGMFIHDQGIAKGMATLTQTPFLGDTPVGIDPYTYRVLTQQSMTDRLSGGAKYAAARTGEVLTELGVGTVGWAVGAAKGAAIGTAILPGVGTAIGGIIGGLGGAITAGLGAEAIIGEIGPTARMWQKRELTNILGSSSWRFAQGFGEDPLGGMSFQQRESFAVDYRRMIGQSPLSHKEGTQVLQVAVERGMFDAVKSIKDMTDKMKEFVSDIKTVSNRAHVDYVTAARVMSEMRDIGYEDYGGATRMMDIRGAMAGRTVMEMLGTARQGAEIFRGTGVPLQFGAETAVGNLNTLRTMQRSGLLSAEYFRQIGGIDAGANALTMGTLQFMMSPLARGLGIGMMGPGSIPDPAKVQNLLSGGIMTGLFQSMNAATPENILQFSANQEQFWADLGPKGVQAVEMSSIFSMAETVARNTFGSSATRDQIINTSDMLMRQKGYDISKRELFKAAFKDPIKFSQELKFDEEGASILEARKWASEQKENKKLTKRFGRWINRLTENVYGSMGLEKTNYTGAAAPAENYSAWSRWFDDEPDKTYDVGLDKSVITDSVIKKLENTGVVERVSEDYAKTVGTEEWLKTRGPDFVHEAEIRKLEKNKKELDKIVNEKDLSFALAYSKTGEKYDIDALALRAVGTEWSATSQQQKAAIIAGARKLYGESWYGEKMRELRNQLGDKNQENKEFVSKQLKRIHDLKEEQRTLWKGKLFETSITGYMSRALSPAFLGLEKIVGNAPIGGPKYGAEVQHATADFLYDIAISEEKEPSTVGPSILKTKQQEYLEKIKEHVDQEQFESIKQQTDTLLQTEHLTAFRERLDPHALSRMKQHKDVNVSLAIAKVAVDLPGIAETIEKKYGAIVSKDPRAQKVIERVRTRGIVQPEKFVQELKMTELGKIIDDVGDLARFTKAEIEVGIGKGAAATSAEELTEKETLLKVNKNMDYLAMLLLGIAQRMGISMNKEEGGNYAF